MDKVDPDVIFGNMIGSELKQFPEHIKFQVKYDLNSVIYKYRLQNMSTQMNSSQAFIQSQMPLSNIHQHLPISSFQSASNDVPAPQYCSSTGAWMSK